MTEHIGINVIISRAVEVLRSDKIFGPRLSNTWLPAATFAEAIMKSGHVDATLTIDARKFNVAMSKSASFGDAMTRFDGSIIQVCSVFATENNTSTISQIQRGKLLIRIR
jgi:hypothetical protein